MHRNNKCAFRHAQYRVKKVLLAGDISTEKTRNKYTKRYCHKIHLIYNLVYLGSNRKSKLCPFIMSFLTTPRIRKAPRQIF